MARRRKTKTAATTPKGRNDQPGDAPIARRPGARSPEPDPARFLDPFDDRVLLAYYHEIARWHGYIRFLGLPHLRDNPDVPIYRLYVEPSISESHIPPERPIDEWPECVPVLDAIADSPRLVLLGDPGSGKSTLVSWIAWQLTQPGDNAWTRRLGRLVPIPMVLRDMKIGRDITWEGLLDAFLELPVAEPLRAEGEGRARLLDLLERGQTIVMLDGLDEIGSKGVRVALHCAVTSAIPDMPASRWLLTSRIVGYNELPFPSAMISKPPTFRSAKGSVRLDIATDEEPDILDIAADEDQVMLDIAADEEQIIVAHRYVAPFADEQVERFAHNWYVQHEQAEQEREQRAHELIKAIAANKGTQHLARIPNLLTLIALIYRVYRWLPHGRALLYDRIAEAYLESIDRFRGLEGLDYPLAQKKRWLAYVGYQMQLRRGSDDEEEDDSESAHRDILVDEEQVHTWIADAMGKSDVGAGAAARRFVDYIARRSGLLLPRGLGQFAFTHLSLQEYFAACHCAEQVTAPRWLDNRARNPSFKAHDLRSHVNDEDWHETLVLLFELLADRPAWSDDLVECLYGKNFAELKNDPKRGKQRAALLLAEVCMDRYAGLSEDRLNEALTACWRWELVAEQQEGPYSVRSSNEMTRYLLSVRSEEREAIWEAFASATECGGWHPPMKTLNLYATLITDAELVHLSKLSGLRGLILMATPVSDLTLLAPLSGLEYLDLDSSQVTDLTPLAGLTELKELDCRSTMVVDLSPLAGLPALEKLYLGKTPVSDPAPLAGLKALATLDLSQTEVADLTPLAGLKGLRTLSLSSTLISDLTPLAGLCSLKHYFGPPIPGHPRFGPKDS